jgi:hypothetical protein
MCPIFDIIKKAKREINEVKSSPANKGFKTEILVEKELLLMEQHNMKNHLLPMLYKNFILFESSLLNS